MRKQFVPGHEPLERRDTPTGGTIAAASLSPLNGLPKSTIDVLPVGPVMSPPPPVGLFPHF